MKAFLRKIFSIDHVIVSAMSLSVVGAFAFMVFNISFLNPIARGLSGFSMSNIYYSIINDEVKPPRNELITIVDMTELHKREQLASVLDDIHDMQPVAIGVDVIFEGYKGDIEGNALLTDTYFNMGEDVVTAVKLADYNAEKGVYERKIRSFFVEDGVPVTEGCVNLFNGPEKTVQSYPVYQLCQEDTISTLPARMAMMVGEDVPTYRHLMDIHYKPDSFAIVSWRDIAANRDLIEGHIVLFGTTQEENDMHYTPVGKIPGVEVIAYATQTMIDHFDITRQSRLSAILWTLLVCVLVNISNFFFASWLKRKNNFTRMLDEWTLIYSFHTFFWMTLVTWITFLLFIRADYYADTVLLLSSLALMTPCRYFYVAFIHYLEKTVHWKFLQRSIYSLSNK